MKPLTAAALMIFMLAGSVMAETIIHGTALDKCAKPNECGACRANNRFYDEMSASAHKDLTCFDCHVPGVVQQSKYEREDRSFNRLEKFKTVASASAMQPFPRNSCLNARKF